MVLLNSVRALGLSMLSPHFPRAGCGPSQVGTERSAGVGEDTEDCVVNSQTYVAFTCCQHRLSAPQRQGFLSVLFTLVPSVCGI